MKAIVVTKPGKLEIVEIATPKVGPYQALVRTEVAALCNSTDSKLVAGHFPGVDKFPMMLGHEGCGIVTAVGKKVRNFKLGDRVIGGLVFQFSDSKYSSGWGGFCEYTLANDHDAMVADGVANAAHGWFECYEIQRKVDKTIPAEEAALICTWREVYGAFGDFNLQAGQEILIYGGGPVGQSFVKFGKLLGLKWIGLVDRHQHKRKCALKMGADAVFAPDSPQLAKFCRQRNRSLDAVIDAIGSPKVINAALPLIKMGGSICVYGVLSEDSLVLAKSTAPYNFNLFIHQWPTRSREREAQKPLCNWIRQGKLKASEFVTHRFAMSEINEALAAVKAGKVLKCLLRY